MNAGIETPTPARGYLGSLKGVVKVGGNPHTRTGLTLSRLRMFPNTVQTWIFTRTPFPQGEH